MRHLLISFFTISFLTNTLSQIELPKIEFDKQEIVFNNELNKYVFYKDDKVVLEKRYPGTSTVQSLCSHSSADSIFIYYSPKLVEVSFNKGRNTINTYEGNIKHVKSFYTNGNKRSERTEVLSYSKDYLSKYPLICGNTVSYLNENVVYDKMGDTIQFGNYNTWYSKGVPTFEISTLFRRLKQKADSVLKENYGRENFEKYIRFDLARTRVTFDRRKLKESGYKPSRFTYPPDSFYTSFVFGYMINLNDSLRYPLISIIVKRNGEVIKENEDFDSYFQCNGLILDDSVGPIIGITEALEIAKEYGVSSNSFNLIWEPEFIGSAKGNLYYRFIENPLKKIEKNGHSMVCDETLINAMNGKLVTTQEYCTISSWEVKHEERFEKNGKYGFIERGGVVRKSDKNISYIFPPIYDTLPEEMKLFMIAKKDGKYGYISDGSEIKIPFNAEEMYFLWFDKNRYNDEFLVVKKGNYFQLYNFHGDLWSKKKFMKIEINEKNQVVGKLRKKEIVFDPKELITANRFKK